MNARNVFRRATLSIAGFLALASTSAAAQVDLASWEEMPARNIGPSGMSGRVAAIDAVVSDPRIIYVGAATGGLWKSTTGGVTWTPIMDHLPTPSIGAIAVFQNAPDIVWVGTGEKNRRNGAGVGNGIYKSMDGGHTWSHLGLENTGSIAEVILDPTNPNVAYVAAMGMAWAENEERGVFKTTDGGSTWEKILYVDEKTGAADLIMDPGNPNKLFAAMWEHRRWPWFFNSGGPGSGLYATYDGGATWDRMTEADGMPPGELGRIGLAISRRSPDVVYALVEATKSVLLRSDNGGRSWDTVNSSDNIAVRPFYYGQIRVDPLNENRVYNVESRLGLSEDGGRNFRVLLPFERVHVDYHAFWVHPDDGKLLIAGNDGGVYISRDRGESWQFVENLPLAQFYHINVDMETPFNVYGGLQDNGSWRGPSRIWENGGIRYYHWQEINFGDGFAALLDPQNPRYVYGTSQGGFITRRDLVTYEGKSVRPAHPDGTPLRFNWNAGLNTDAGSGCVYYGSQFVHRSCDMGETWQIVSPDLTTNDPEKQRQLESGGLTYDVTAAENHTSILTIAPSPVQAGVIWVGTDDGYVQITQDDGATWTNVVDRIRGVPENTWVPHIEPSKFDAATAFVVFDDHRRSNNSPFIYKTTNFGRDWESLVTDEIEGFIHVVEQDPVDPDLLYLGTEYGMYVSLNGGANWQLWTHGLPRAPVRALVVHPRDHDLVIGTHGRAAYILDDVRPLRTVAAVANVASPPPVTLFEIPPAIQYVVKQVGGMRFLADAKYIGENRPYGALISYMSADSGSAEIIIQDASGDTVRTLTDEARAGFNRTAWNLARERVRPRGEEGGGAFTPPGPRVLPGGYTVVVKVGDHESAPRTVEVHGDPRQNVSMADRGRKLDAILHVSDRQRVANEAFDRLNKAKESIDNVLRLLPEDADSSLEVLRADGETLTEAIDEVREEFNGPQDVQGILRRPNTVFGLLGQASGFLSSSTDAPTEAMLTYVGQAEQRLQQVLDQVNELFAGDVTDFSRRAAAAGLQFFASYEPIGIDWRPEN